MQDARGGCSAPPPLVSLDRPAANVCCVLTWRVPCECTQCTCEVSSADAYVRRSRIVSVPGFPFARHRKQGQQWGLKLINEWRRGPKKTVVVQGCFIHSLDAGSPAMDFPWIALRCPNLRINKIDGTQTRSIPYWHGGMAALRYSWNECWSVE